jgi:hypothetical protein
LLVLVAALLAPVAEAFDSWDATPGLANDTEWNVAALALVAGLFAAVAFVACVKLPAGTPQKTRGLRARGRMFRGAVPLPFFPGCSPPGLPLRI